MSLDKGKLLLTNYKGKVVLLHIQNNRLVFARAFSENGSLVGNVYIGKVTNVLKNIDAAFVEIFPGQICFLPMKECHNATLTNRTFDGRIVAGDEVVVQVSKDAVKTKQPVVTANISFTGTYCVVSTGKKKTSFSTKLSEGEKKTIGSYFKTIKPELPKEQSVGYVFRTNCRELADDFEPLKKELLLLTKKANEFLDTVAHRTCYSLLSKQEAPYLAAVTNIYQSEYEEIVTDDETIFAQLKDCEALKKIPVRLYADEMLSLHKLYSVDTKISEALSKNVWLKSGGYLVIEPTEALTVIDVNTGKAIAKRTPQEQFFLTNMEAAEEIALQLKLRNISGIVIVDFINMESTSHEEKVLSRLRELLKTDSVKTSVIDITPLGLVEITRQKVNSSLSEQFKV